MNTDSAGLTGQLFPTDRLEVTPEAQRIYDIATYAIEVERAAKRTLDREERVVEILRTVFDMGRQLLPGEQLQGEDQFLQIHARAIERLF